MNPLLLLLAISNRNDISTTVLTIYSQFITRRYTHIHIIPSNIVLRSNRTSIDTKRHYLEKEQFIEPFIIVMPFQIQGGSRCESSSQLGRKDLSWIGNGETTRCFHEARISRCKNCQARYPLTKPKCKRMGARTKKFPLKYRPERQLFSELVLTTRSLSFFFLFFSILLTTTLTINLSINRESSFDRFAGATLHPGGSGYGRGYPGAFLDSDGLLQRGGLERQRAHLRGGATRGGYRGEYDDRHPNPICDRPGPRLRR